MSMRKAINEKCKDCIYDPQSGGGTWREQTQNCADTTCPLYPYRPMSRPRIAQANRPIPEGLRRYMEATKA